MCIPSIKTKETLSSKSLYILYVSTKWVFIICIYLLFLSLVLCVALALLKVMCAFGDMIYQIVEMLGG